VAEKCEICGKWFRSKRGLSKHKEKEHPDFRMKIGSGELERMTKEEAGLPDSLRSPKRTFSTSEHFREQSLNELINQEFGKFERWLQRRVDPKTAYDYLHALKTHFKREVHEPKDFDEFILETSKQFRLGLRSFLNWWELTTYSDNLLGFSTYFWRKFIPLKKSNKREVFLETGEVKEALALISEKWDKNTLLFAKILVVSGIRLKQAYRMLSTFEPAKIRFDGKVAFYPLMATSRGTKLGNFAFIPKELAEQLEVENFSRLKCSTYEWRITPKRWKPPMNNRFDANACRTWFLNFAIENGLLPEAVRFIVGHKSQSTAEAHYFNLLKIARKEYSKLAPKICELVLGEEEYRR